VTMLGSRLLAPVAFAVFGLSASVVSAGEVAWGDQISKGFRGGAARVELIPSAGHTKAIFHEETLPVEVRQEFDEKFAQDGVRSALLMKGDKIIYRYLRNGNDAGQIPLGFSMSKSLTAITVGHALCDGKIESLDDAASKYVPELAKTTWGVARVRDLLKMASGAYETKLDLAGYKDSTQREKLNMAFRGGLDDTFEGLIAADDSKSYRPGAVFNYSNADTLVLSLIVASATGKSFAQYFADTTWRMVGAAEAGGWITNSKGQSLAYAGFSATAEDWLRVGRWVSDTIGKSESCIGDFMRQATTHQISVMGPAPADSYGYQIWVNCVTGADFCFLGHYGQHLLVNNRLGLVMHIHSASEDESVYRTKTRFTELLATVSDKQPDSARDRLSIQWQCNPGKVKDGREQFLSQDVRLGMQKTWNDRTHVQRRDGDSWDWFKTYFNGAVVRWRMRWVDGEVQLNGSLTNQNRNWNGHFELIRRSSVSQLIAVPVIYETNNIQRRCSVTVTRH
jgi:CubicO group peptidase (beta-lactamase class C family)